MNKESSEGLNIAVVGLSGAFPGAKNIDEFLSNLKHGNNCISFFSDDELENNGVSRNEYGKKNYIKAKGVLDNYDNFDNFFFGYTPKEALYLDPQTRLLHEHTWKALEDAGYVSKLDHTVVGMYVGGKPHFHWELVSLIDGIDNEMNEFELTHLNDKDLMSTRVSYKLNLKGPSFSLYTACSTSLVAVHLACQGILSGECELAVAGGVAVSTPMKRGYYYQDGMILSKDGYCRPFDEKASGTVPGNGIGLVVLKKLEKAIEDNDNIYAVIKGTAINNDGNHKVAYTAPSIIGQVNVIRTAQAIAGVKPEQVSYIEAHGTGTLLGDPIEFKALTEAFHTNKKHYCGIGSVKSLIGHLDSASGVSGLIKAILSLKYKKLFPSLFFTEPNRNISINDSPFYIVDSLREWNNDGLPLYAGVSSFGVGGTNAHVVLGEAPSDYRSTQNSEKQIFVFSAKTEESLNRYLKEFLTYLKENSEHDLHRIAFTLQQGKKHFNYRKSVICGTSAELCIALQNEVNLLVGNTKEYEKEPLYFYYLDEYIEGYQYNNKSLLELPLGKSLYNNYLQRLCTTLNISQEDLLDDKGEYVRVFGFLMQVCISELLIQIGVAPDKIVTGKLGVYVAACISGILSFETAAILLELHSKLIEEQQSVDEDIFLIESIQEEYNGIINRTPFQKTMFPVILAVNGSDISQNLSSSSYWKTSIEGMLYVGTQDVISNNKDKSVFVIFGDKECVKNQLPDFWKETSNFLIYLAESNKECCNEGKLLEASGKLWEIGYQIQWGKLYLNEKEKKVSLPSYSFEPIKCNFEVSQLKKMNERYQNQRVVIEKNESNYLYSQSWNRIDEVQKYYQTKQGKYLVFELDDPIVQRCIEKLRTNGQSIISIKCGTEFYCENQDQYYINPQCEDDYRKVLEEVNQSDGDIQGIFYFWSIQNQLCQEKKYYENSVKEFCYYSILNIVKAFGQFNISNEIQLCFVINDLFNIFGTENVDPMKSIILGPLRNIPKEYTYLKCHLIEISSTDNDVCDVLTNELNNTQYDSDVIAIRMKNLWKPVYTSVSEKSVKQDSYENLQKNGVYVITGGLGGIGLTIAQDLADNYHASIIFLSRSQFLPESEWDRWIELQGDTDEVSKKINKIKNIKQSANALHIISANVADEKCVLEAFQEIANCYNKVNGIFHTAGIPDGTAIQHRSREASEVVFAPKIKGTMTVCEMAKETFHDLDFIVLFSSLSTLIAPGAQVAYCAANAFIDAYAKKNSSQNLLIQAIGWDQWTNVGMSTISGADIKSFNSHSVSFQYLNHPLFNYMVKQHGDKAVFISELSPEKNWVLSEHRIEGNAVLPGTCYIEIVEQAYHILCNYETKKICLENVIFTNLLNVKDKNTVIVRTSLIKELSGWQYQIESYSDERTQHWMLHSSGKIAEMNNVPKKNSVANVIKEIGGEEYGIADYNNSDKSKFIYGERWKCYQWGKFEEQQGISKIQLPKQFLSDMDLYSYHPALMDVALVFMHHDNLDSKQYIPFSYSSINIYNKIPHAFYSYIKKVEHSSDNDDFLEYNLLILAENGDTIVEITGYRMIEITETMKRKKGIKIEDRIQENAKELKKKPDIAKTYGLIHNEGVEILKKVLSTRYKHLIVSTLDLNSRIENNRYKDNEVFYSESKRKHKNQEVLLEFTKDNIEQMVTNIWKRVLGYDNLSLEDDFFSLGGDSLKVLNIAEMIHERTGIRIPMGVFFKLTTIKELRDYIHQVNHKENDNIIIKKQEKLENYELSSQQKRLFYHSKINPDSMAYNIAEVLFLNGKLDLTRLQDAMQRLINKYRVLRTGFDIVNGNIVQTIYDHVEANISFSKVKQSKLSSIVEGFMKPFDLKKPPLFRLSILQYNLDKYVWMFDIHHIIADNISVSIIKHELFQLYRESGQDVFDENKIDYIDYIYWQKEMIEKGKLSQQYEFWRKKLIAHQPVLNLPLDYKRPEVLEHKGDIYKFIIDHDNHEKLINLGVSNNITTYMTMMSIFSILLYKYSGQSEFYIGTSLAGRNSIQLESVIGMFANVLPLYINIDADDNYIDYIKSIKHEMLQVFENQEAQLDIIIQQLQYHEYLNRNPLFDTMLVMPDMDKNMFEKNEISFEEFPFRNKTSKFDITLWIYDFEDHMELRFEYSTELFKRETIKAMAEHFVRIVEQIVTNNDIIIKDIQLSSKFVKMDNSKELDMLNDESDGGFVFD